MDRTFRVEFGVFQRQDGTARAWASPATGVAAVTYGEGSPFHAPALFARLASIPERVDGPGHSGYPPRVIEAAKALEALHRELWQLRRDENLAAPLGVGVLVIERDRAYFLQVGGIAFYRAGRGDVRVIATPDPEAPLLGVAVKSGIRVHGARLEAHDRLLVFPVRSSSLVDTGAVGAALGVDGDAPSDGARVLDLVAATGDAESGTAVVTADVVVRVPEETAASPRTMSVDEVLSSMERAGDPSRSRADVDAGRGRAAPTSGQDKAGWDFHTDVVAELSDYVRGLQSQPPSTAADSQPAPPDAVADEADPEDAHEGSPAWSGGPAIVPPAVNPISVANLDEPALESAPSREMRTNADEVEEGSIEASASVWHEASASAWPEGGSADEKGRLEDAGELVAVAAGSEGSASNAPPAETATAPQGTEPWRTDSWDSQPERSRWRSKVTSYRFAILTVILVGLPVAYYVFGSQVRSWLENVAGDRESPMESPPPARTVPDTSPSLDPEGSPADSVPAEATGAFGLSIDGPKGGRIQVDGEVLGSVTPLDELKLSAGVHDIVVDYGETGRWSGQVKVLRDGMRVDARPRGHIQFRAPGRGFSGELRLDGETVPQWPASAIETDAGEHLVSADGQGISGFERRVFVAGGDTTLVSLPSPREGQGLLIAESRRFVGDGFDEARGDSIWLDRTFVGLTPLELEVKPGIHSVRISSTVNESVTQIVEVRPDVARVTRADFGSQRRLTLSHPLRGGIRSGEPLFLPALVRENDSPSAERLFCLFRTIPEATFQSLEMRRVQAGSDYWVATVPESETAGGWLQYYFTAIDADGVQVVSELYELGSGRTSGRVAQRGS